jgi:hypothetical protein
MKFASFMIFASLAIACVAADGETKTIRGRELMADCPCFDAVALGFITSQDFDNSKKNGYPSCNGAVHFKGDATYKWIASEPKSCDVGGDFPKAEYGVRSTEDGDKSCYLFRGVGCEGEIDCCVFTETTILDSQFAACQKLVTKQCNSIKD